MRVPVSIWPPADRGLLNGVNRGAVNTALGHPLSLSGTDKLHELRHRSGIIVYPDNGFHIEIQPL